MHLRLLLGDAALSHEVGHHAVVLGELGERAVPQQVAAAVAHVGDQEVLGWFGVVIVRLFGVGFLGHEGERHHRGAHPPQVRVGVALVADAVVGHGDGLSQGIGGGVLVRDLQRLDGQPGGNFSALVTTHPVGHDEEVAVREQHEAVLVDGPGTAHVGGGPGPQDDTAHELSSSTVLPICSLSPRCTTIGPVTLRRLR